MRRPIAALSTTSTLVLLSALLLTSGAAQSTQPQTAAADNKRHTPTTSPVPSQVLPITYDVSEAPRGYALSDLEFLERYCFEEVNRQREAQNLAPLVLARELLPPARRYSRRLAEERFFSHIDPQGRSVENRLQEAGVRFQGIGENLSQATDYLDPVPDVVQHWMKSPGHRANILNPKFQYAAVGVWIREKTVYFTEIFLTK